MLDTTTLEPHEHRFMNKHVLFFHGREVIYKSYRSTHAFSPSMTFIVIFSHKILFQDFFYHKLIKLI